MRRALASLFVFGSIPFLFASLPSCSSDEFEGGGATGGSGGKAGDSGLGGSSGSGTGGATSCTDSSECDDGKACNGTETCAAGKCVPGTDAKCTNPDPDHCLATCDDANGDVCTIAAKDGDGDNHGDSQCTQATTGVDDCDDTNPDVSPEATEACNGIDDDCDEKDDLSDGFQLYGAEFELLKSTVGASAYQPAIVWGADSYGMTWVDTRDAGKARIYFVLVNADGSLKTAPVALSDPSFPAASVQPDIAFNGTDFAVIWSSLRFILIGADGTPKPPIVVNSKVGLEPSLQWSGASWLLGYSRTELRGSSLTSSGQPGEEKIIGGTAGQDAEVVRSALVGSTLGYAWHDMNFATKLATVYFARADTSMTALGSGSLTTESPTATDTSENPRIGAVGDRFGIAYRRTVGTSATAEYVERKLDGSPGCGPLVLDSASAGVTSPWPEQVGKFGNRTAVLLMDGTGNAASLKLARIDDACGLIDTPNLAVSAMNDPERNATFAKGDNGYIVIWVKGDGANRSIRARVFGPNICDGPS